MMPQSTPSLATLSPSAFAERLDVFSGAANPAEARLYARLELTADEVNRGLQLAGRVVGPECMFSHTLPARMPMMDRSGNGALLLEAVIPDPCFWTPELPFLYRVEIELRHNDQTLAKAQRTIGVRRLGVRGPSLHFEGKRFVLRGVHLQSEISNFKSQIEPVAAFCRETWTALAVPKPTDDLGEWATRQGVLLIADLTAEQTDTSRDMASLLRRLARWPSVALAVLKPGVTLPAELGSELRNLLLAQHVADGEPLHPAPWAQLLIVEALESRSLADKLAGCNLPIVAYRRQSEEPDVESARAACDGLQRDLSSLGDFAGYLV